LEAAAVSLGAGGALGGGGLPLGAGGRAGAKGAASTAGRAGRFASSTAGRGVTRTIAGKVFKWIPLVGWVAEMTLNASETASNDTTMTPNTGGVRGGDPASLGLSNEQYDIFRNTLAKRESGGRYNIMGGSSGRFAGKYQMGRGEIDEVAKSLGVASPSQQEFLNNPEMQERFFLQYTLMHHQQLMRDPGYAAMTPEQSAGTLATAHLKGVGGALRQIHGGSAGVDAFNTSGASYSRMVTDAFRQHSGQVDRARAGQQVAMNDNRGGGGPGDQTVHVNGPIVINTQATDARGIARGLRGELAGRRVASPANTGLA